MNTKTFIFNRNHCNAFKEWIDEQSNRISAATLVATIPRASWAVSIIEECFKIPGKGVDDTNGLVEASGDRLIAKLIPLLGEYPDHAERLTKASTYDDKWEALACLRNDYKRVGIEFKPRGAAIKACEALDGYTMPADGLTQMLRAHATLNGGYFDAEDEHEAEVQLQDFHRTFPSFARSVDSARKEKG